MLSPSLPVPLNYLRGEFEGTVGGRSSLLRNLSTSLSRLTETREWPSVSLLTWVMLTLVPFVWSQQLPAQRGVLQPAVRFLRLANKRQLKRCPFQRSGRHAPSCPVHAAYYEVWIRWPYSVRPTSHVADQSRPFAVLHLGQFYPPSDSKLSYCSYLSVSDSADLWALRFGFRVYAR